jgi:superfamily II DNA or RNA helicase
MPRNHRNKGADDLAKQIEEVNDFLSIEGEEPLDLDITPQTSAELKRLEENGEDLMELNVDKIRQIYGRRFRIYLDILRKKDPGKMPEDQKRRYRNIINALNGLDNYFAEHELKRDDPQAILLRPLQMKVLNALQEFLEKDKNAGYVKLPTGTGKTAIFLEMIEAMDLPTILVVPNNTLVNQLAKTTTDDEGKIHLSEIAKFAPKLAKNTGIVNMHNKDYGKQLTVITYQSLSLLVQEYLKIAETVKFAEKEGMPIDEVLLEHELETYNKVQFLRNAGLIILDEAHRCQSSKRKQIVGLFHDQITIGFTATPDFSKDKKLEQILPEEIYSKTIKESVEDGELCDVAYPTVYAHSEVDLSKVARIKTEFGEDYDTVGLRDQINSVELRKEAIDYYTGHHNGERAVIYCIGTIHAKNVCEDFAGTAEFTSNGYTAAFISGDEIYVPGEMAEPMNKRTVAGREKEQEVLQRFKDGDIRVLCNADLLIEGFNVPSANVCMNLRPTMSPVVEEQRCGRVLRKKEGKTAHIIDYIYKDKNDKGKTDQITFRDIYEGTWKLGETTEETKSVGGGEAPARTILDVEGVDQETEYEGQTAPELFDGFTEEEISRLIKEEGYVDYGLKENKLMPKEIAEAILDWLYQNTKEKIVFFRNRYVMHPDIYEVLKIAIKNTQKVNKQKKGKPWVHPQTYVSFHGETDESESLFEKLDARRMWLMPSSVGNHIGKVMQSHAGQVGFFKSYEDEDEMDLYCDPEVADDIVDKIVDSAAEPVDPTEYVPCGNIFRKFYEGGIKEFHQTAMDLIESDYRFANGDSFKELWERIFAVFRDRFGNLNYFYRRAGQYRENLNRILDAMGVSMDSL